MSTETDILAVLQKLDRTLGALVPKEQSAAQRQLNWGVDDSGPPVLVSARADPAGDGTVGISQNVINIDCKSMRTKGAERGGRTVVISVISGSDRESELTPNSALTLTISVATGRQVLEAEKVIKVDGSRGVTFFVNAADVVRVDAQSVSDEIDGTTGLRKLLVPGNDWIVSGSAVWGECTPPLQMYSQATRVALAAGVAGPVIRVPNFSNVMSVNTTTATAITASFFNIAGLRSTADFGRTQQTTAQIAVPLGGVDRYSLTATVDTLASPFFAINI